MSAVALLPDAPVSRRAPWVDAARCVAMYPIIWLHIPGTPSWAGQLVGGALFLFFLLAGYFMPHEARPCTVRGLKLAAAWVLWSLLAALFCCSLSPEDGVDWYKLLGWGVNAYDTPLWFLRNLALFELLIAALLWLRLLPRYVWVLVLVLVSMAYVGKPAQHLTIRFDWFWVTVLGFGLRCVPVAQAGAWLGRNAALLIPACLVVLYQPWLWKQCVGEVRGCSLPTYSAAWCVLYLLLALAVQRFLPRAARAMAFSGRGMMFCYVTHIFFLAPFYAPDNNLTWCYNFWVPPVLMAVLPFVGCVLQRHFPRIMRVLLAR